MEPIEICLSFEDLLSILGDTRKELFNVKEILVITKIDVKYCIWGNDRVTILIEKGY